MGITRLTPVQEPVVLEAWASSRRRTPIVVDLSAASTKADVLAAIARAARFPDWFGHNLDALADCLGDLSWWDEDRLTLLLVPGGALDALPAHDRDGVLGVLDQVADDDRLEVVLVVDA